MNLNNLYNQPLKLEHNRVWRMYTGGLLLEKWNGFKNPKDSHYPEEWIASTIEARNPDHMPGEGLSRYVLEDGNEILFRDIVNSNPEVFLGKSHVDKYGSSMAMLVKLIDSYSRLPIQVHPDKFYAKEILGSDFGKTEAWYILDSRIIERQEPYVLLGFKPGITKEIWQNLFNKQDKEGMINALHLVNIKPNEVYLIEGGVPHAIGPGYFLIEVQEPTDYTMKVEKTAPDGSPLSDFSLHQGAGFDKLFDCFHYDSYSREGTIEKYRKNPCVVNQTNEGQEVSLISYSDTPYFAMNKINVTGSFKNNKDEKFSVDIILAGKGKLIWEGGEMKVSQADQLFLPAGLGDITWQCEEENTLEIIKCYPPK